MITKFKKSFEPLIAIIARPFLSWNPAILTLLSLASSILFFFGLVEHIYWLSVLSILGFGFDMLDGYVARKTGKTSSFGAFLDSTLDRVSDFFFIVSFAFAHLVSWELTVIVLFTSLLISYMRARGEAVFHLDKPLAEGLMQRTERILLIYLGFILFLLFPKATFGSLTMLSSIFLLIATLNIYTIFQRFLFFATIK
jgi:phosphatidylglycerophosphate synthase